MRPDGESIDSGVFPRDMRSQVVYAQKFARSVCTLFLGTLLVWASVQKMVNPDNFLQSFAAVLEVVDAEFPRSSIMIMSSVFIMIELAIGLYAMVAFASLTPRVLIFLLYLLFFASVILLATLSPESGCGCGFDYGQPVGVDGIVRSGVFLGIAGLQLPGIYIARDWLRLRVLVLKREML